MKPQDESAAARPQDVRKVRLGASACLLGRPVRYDGRDKRDPYLADALARLVEWVPVCPEVECGLGVPRPSMRLVADAGGAAGGARAVPRLLAWEGGADHAPRMMRWVRRRLRELQAEDLWGFILKGRSPSCGLGSTPIHPAGGGRPRKGSGLFAQALVERLPLVPAEESERLADPAARADFFARVFALRRWRDFLASGGSRAGLVAFHTAHKMVLLAHSPRHYREMGRLVADLKRRPGGELRAQYGAMLAEALARPATRSRHVNVLQHLAGFLKKRLADAEKRAVAETVARFRGGRAPLDAATGLLHRLAEKHQEAYLLQQVYLKPDPLEKTLRGIT